jgi:hypothetical protein
MKGHYIPITMRKAGAEGVLFFKYLNFNLREVQQAMINFPSHFLYKLIKHSGSSQTTANDCKIVAHLNFNPEFISFGIILILFDYVFQTLNDWGTSRLCLFTPMAEKSKPPALRVVVDSVSACISESHHLDTQKTFKVQIP